MGSSKAPKIPAPPPPPPPVSATGAEQKTADIEERRRQGRRYSFDRTILAPPPTGKTTLG